MSRRAISDESGQGTVEWTALILLVSLALTALLALAGLARPGAALARAVAEKLICAAGLADGCGGPGSELALAYGADLAAALREHAPDLLYERSMSELPVDYRDCREDPCSNGLRSAGAVSSTVGGLPATAFVHVVDCRSEAAATADASAYECSGERAGRLYLQYWLYFPDSQTDPFGGRGYHRDDWESFQVRLGEGAAEARASSHHSYNYDGGIKNWISDSGAIKKSAWGPYSGTHHISAGSHAGHVAGERDEPMHTPGAELALVPIEPIADAGSDDGLFAVTPPWLKDVYRDPESNGT